MRYIGRDLLILLISLFILSSCQNSDEIGLDVKPADQINGILIDTTTVKTTTVIEGPLLTNGLLRHPLGYLNDLQIGQTESNLAMALTLPAANFAFDKLPLLDSAVLVLRYGDEFYGTSGVPYTINVHQLTEKVNPKASYYNTKTWQYDSQVIGGKQVTNFNITDSIRITKRRQGKDDTVLLVPPQLRIPIDESFIRSAFFNADTANFADNVKFNNFIKGLYLTVEQSVDANGMIFFNFEKNGISGLDLYYKTFRGSVIDTNDVHFAISNDSTAASIKHTYSTNVQTQLNNPTQQFSTVYVQPLSGLRAKINFPYIDKLKALGNIVINKAELVVTLADGSDAIFSAAPRLILYRTDIAGQRQFVPDNSGVDARTLLDEAFGGFYDSSKKRYTFAVTSYIQDILSGKMQQYDTYIAPIFTDAERSKLASAESTGSTAARSILNSGSSSSPYKMKLNIIYTKLNL